MSSGRQAYHDDHIAEMHNQHQARLEQLGYNCIANLVRDIRQQIEKFEQSKPSLSRESWRCFDSIKEKVELLK